MKKVFKYELNGCAQLTELDMPVGAKVLCVQTDQKTDTPCIWAIVDEDAPLETRVFEIIPTGVGFTDREDVVYIGTFQTYSGHFVGHVFEEL